MGIQENINSIAKLGFYLDILVDEQGGIIAGVYSKPLAPSGMSFSILDPAYEKGNDLKDVLNSLVKRLLKQIKEQGNV